MESSQEKTIHRLFTFSVTLKGIHAFIEVIGGILLYFISTSFITTWVVRLTQEELSEDPHDLISNYFLSSAQNFSIGAKSFAAFYLFSHGAVKLFLVAGLLRNKLWAYPVSLVVLGLFILYQTYRFTFTHSLGLIALTAFDLIVIWLVTHEYRLIRKHQSRT